MYLQPKTSLNIWVIFLHVVCFASFAQNSPPNIGFELTPQGQYYLSNSVSDWVIQNGTNAPIVNLGCAPNPSLGLLNLQGGSPEFSIVSTPVASYSTFPFFSLPHSPLGGTKVARLNNLVPYGLMNRVSTQFTVGSTNNLLQLAVAGAWDGIEDCCAGANFRVDFYSCSNPTMNIGPLTHLGHYASVSCGSGVNYSTTGSVNWTNWRLLNFDLSLYAGQCITMVISNSDCAFGGHFGTLYVDAGLGPQLAMTSTSNLYYTGLGSSVSFCPGATVATIQAPLGYTSYQWLAPGGFAIPPPTGTSQTLPVNFPVGGSVYTLTAYSNATTYVIFTYTLTTSSVVPIGIGTSSSCPGGSTGSGTVLANGSGSGYTYNWLNSLNQTVGTSSVVNNLAAGIYSVVLGALGSPACGTATITTTVSVKPPNSVQSVLKPFCNNEAYMCAGSGSNYQWYNNTTAIPGPTGAAPCFTVTSPVSGAIYAVRFTNNQGCLDSTQYTLGSMSPGAVSVLTSTYTCINMSNGSAAITATPTSGSQTGQMNYSVTGSGTSAATYSYVNGPISFTTVNLNNLPSGNYTVNVFDGSCRYSNTFNLVPYLLSFTLGPESPTLCPGQMAFAGVNFSSQPQPNQFTYSWTPSSYLAGTQQQATIINSVNLAPGTQSSIVYTIVVTPTLINCSFTHTLLVTWSNPVSPSINPIPVLCQNSSGYTIGVSPQGGTFYSNINNSYYPVASSSGIISTTLSAMGLNTFTYVTSFGNCSLNAIGTYSIAGPSLTVNPVAQVCPGHSVAIQANGASSYTWSNGATSPSIAVTISANTIYTVIGASPGTSCTSIQTLVLNVIPNIAVSGNLNICLTHSTTLYASGAFSYTWSNGSNSYQCIVQPSVTTTYTVSGTSQNCINQTVATVTVNPGPLLQISGPTLVCEGEEFVLSASGANTYTWNTGSNSFSISTYQWASNLYTLSANSASNSCTAHTIIIVNTSPCLFNHTDSADDRDFQLFPNPNKGSFVLSTPVICELIIFDGLGRMVYSKGLQAGINSVEASGISKGVYTVQIRSNGMVRHSKVLID